jgi:hypothetical protein
MIVDGNVNIVIAQVARSLAAVMTGDAVADLCKTAQFLDVKMYEVAGPFALIAAHRLRWIEPVTPIEAHTFEDVGDCGARKSESARNIKCGQAECAQPGNDVVEGGSEGLRV